MHLRHLQANLINFQHSHTELLKLRTGALVFRLYLHELMIQCVVYIMYWELFVQCYIDNSITRNVVFQMREVQT